MRVTSPIKTTTKNILANYPELFPANILSCLKSLAWKDFRGDRRVYSSPYPGKFSAMELGCNEAIFVTLMAIARDRLTYSVKLDPR